MAHPPLIPDHELEAGQQPLPLTYSDDVIVKKIYWLLGEAARNLREGTRHINDAARILRGDTGLAELALRMEAHGARGKQLSFYLSSGQKDNLYQK